MRKDENISGRKFSLDEFKADESFAQSNFKPAQIQKIQIFLTCRGAFLTVARAMDVSASKSSTAESAAAADLNCSSSVALQSSAAMDCSAVVSSSSLVAESSSAVAKMSTHITQRKRGKRIIVQLRPSASAVAPAAGRPKTTEKSAFSIMASARAAMSGLPKRDPPSAKKPPAKRKTSSVAKKKKQKQKQPPKKKKKSDDASMVISPAPAQPSPPLKPAVEVIHVDDVDEDSDKEEKHINAGPTYNPLEPLNVPDAVIPSSQASEPTAVAGQEGHRQLRERPHIRRAPSGMIESSLIEFIDDRKCARA